MTQADAIYLTLQLIVSGALFGFTAGLMIWFFHR